MAMPFSAMSADNVRLMLDFLPTGDYAPYYAAIDNGIYAKNNISLKITRGTGSGDTILKVAGGAADIGMADISAVISARQRNNTPVKSIATVRSEEHTSELQSLMRISYAVFCLTTKTQN